MALSNPSTPIANQHLPIVAPVQGGGIYSNASLYVGDLEGSVTEKELYEIFSRVGNILSIRVCRDLVRRVSLGYAYVNYSTPQEASQALEILNFDLIHGKPMRIMFSNRDPSIRKSGYANVFIKNLDTDIDTKTLHDIFAPLGNILSCKVATDSNGQSKGHGFVQFEHEESAQNAIKQLNGMLINDKKVYVGLFVRRQERVQVNGSQKFTNVYVKNFSERITDEDLKNIFGNYGSVTSAVVMKDGNGKSKSFGFVNFENSDDAANAVEQLNGFTKDDKVWYVGKAQSKAEREAELKMKYEQERNSRLEKLQGANLYLKNLDDDINDEKLKELFSGFGTITSCKVMVDSQGLSRGSGFVAFTTPEEASYAVNEMNGKMVGRKPLYVAIAQRKEERRARLQAHFAQLRTPGVIAPILQSGLPGYPSAPRVAPAPIYFGQGSPGIIPPQPSSYGFQQLMPGIRPGVPPNFFMPYHLQRQGQPGQRTGPRRGGNQHNMQQQFFQRNGNHGLRYMPNGRNGVDPSLLPQGIPGPIVPLPVDVGGIPIAAVDTPRLPPVTISTLASALASASPEHQRLMLGEQLYPLVEQMERDHSGKVTGMLLEMDQTEVLHLIEAPDALKKKVGEAMEVLRMALATSSDPADQLGSISSTSNE